MTEDQIKHMVNRFLGWTLPENFSPDGGISFKRLENHHHHPAASPFYPMPTGTNLLDAAQAEAMVRHMLQDLPGAPQTVPSRDDIALVILDELTGSTGLADDWLCPLDDDAARDQCLDIANAILALSRPHLAREGE